MTDVTQLLTGSGSPQPQRQVVAGYVSTNKPAPSAFGDPLYVVLPSFNTGAYYGPCKWGAAEGSTLPAQGAEVLVCFDDSGVPVVVWWEGSPEFAPSGAAGGDLTGSYPNPTIGAGKAGTDAVVADNLQTGSSLGTGSFDGQLAYYLADGTNGVVWTFRYRSGSASGSKWEFVGGPGLYALVDAAESTVSTSYTNLTTTGPSVTVPLAGDYDVEVGALISHPTAAAYTGFMSYAIGATAASDANSVQSISSGQFDAASTANCRRLGGIAASTAFVAKYRTQAGADTATFTARWMRITPVRVT